MRRGTLAAVCPVAMWGLAWSDHDCRGGRCGAASRGGGGYGELSMSFLLLIIKGVLRLIVFASVFWLCAGRVDLPLAWAYWGVWLGFMVVGLLCIGFSTRFRELALERNKPGPGAVENRRCAKRRLIEVGFGHSENVHASLCSDVSRDSDMIARIEYNRDDHRHAAQYAG